MPPAGLPISIPTKLLATGVACALAVVVCGTAATVVVASDVTNRLNRGGDRPGASPVLPTNAAIAGSFRDAGATAQALDSLLRPLGALKPVDDTISALLGAFNSDRAASPVWLSGAATTPASVPSRAPRRFPVAFALDSLSPVEIEETRLVLGGPWTPIFRAWARSAPQPALWGYRANLPGTTDSHGLPIRSFNPWRAIFAANEYAGLLALRHGDTGEAMQRAFENISASRHFLEQPVLMDALVGRLYLHRGLELAVLIAKQSRDSITANRATRLIGAEKNFVGAALLHALTQAENLHSSQVAEVLIANRDVHPALRIEALRTITNGGCHSLPEVVFGFSGERRAALARAAASLSDMYRGDELVAREQRVLDAMDNGDGPDVLPGTSILEKNVLLNAFSWIVPPGVRARAALCLSQGYRSQSVTARENAVVGVH